MSAIAMLRPAHRPAPEAEPAPAGEAEALMAMIRRIRHHDLRRYCIDQIRSARSPEEITAAVSLAQAVALKRA